MRLVQTSISGIGIIENEPVQDHRGTFCRLHCARELETLLGFRQIVQINHSVTRRVGAIRGLHFQFQPDAEAKIVRCLKGRVFDVAVDLRYESPTLLQWVCLELSPADNRALFIPEGCAHGYQVLEPDSELLYLHTAFHAPNNEGGVRFDDPRIGIDWPLDATDLSEKDSSHAYLKSGFAGILT